jgi:hypothetical protein
MSGSSTEPEFIREQRVEVLLENSDGILKQKEDIRTVFDQTVDSELRFNNFDEIFDSLNRCLYSYVEEEEVTDVSEAILNTVLSFDSSIADDLIEDGENGKELFKFLTELEAQYRLPLRRTAKRMQVGHDWWRNVTTEPCYRSGRPMFDHEVVKDYEEVARFSCDAENT